MNTQVKKKKDQKVGQSKLFKEDIIKEEYKKYFRRIMSHNISNQAGIN